MVSVAGGGRSTSEVTWPRPLVPGDRVAIVSPGGPPEPERVEAGLALLRSWGLEPDEPHRGSAHWIFSGDDDERRRLLQAALDDEGIKAVLCSRGGYGTQRIVDDLDVGAFVERRATFVGFSDATPLIAKLNAAGLVALHGPCLAWDDEHNGDEARESLREALLGTDPLELLGTADMTDDWDVPATPVEGPLVGGNLTLLATCVGTGTEIRADGAIVLLEEDDESSRQVDRLLTQLLRSGALAGAAGYVLGQLTREGPSDGRTALEVVRERLAPLGVPIVGGFQVGHGDEQLTVPLGAPATLDPAAARLTIPRRQAGRR
jgi:muramoyltetrapeptide carboxypeptidase